MEKSNKQNSPRKIADAFKAAAESKYQVAEMSIVYNQIVKPSDRPKVSTSKDAVSVLRPLIGMDMDVREVFYVLYLNRLNSIVAAYKVGLGGVGSVAVDVKLILFGAINCLAAGIILAHNHPSGSLMPSQPDMNMTRKISEAAKLMDIVLLDHIIVTSEGHYSFADDGMI